MSDISSVNINNIQSINLSRENLNSLYILPDILPGRVDSCMNTCFVNEPVLRRRCNSETNENTLETIMRDTYLKIISTEKGYEYHKGHSKTEVEWAYKVAKEWYLEKSKNLPTNKKIKLYVGSPCAGKTHMARLLDNENEYLYNDVDIYKQEIAFKDIHKWHRWGGLVSELVSELCIHFNKPMIMVCTMSDEKWYTSWLSNIKKSGYEITVVNIVCNIETRIRRYLERSAIVCMKIPDKLLNDDMDTQLRLLLDNLVEKQIVDFVTTIVNS